MGWRAGGRRSSKTYQFQHALGAERNPLQTLHEATYDTLVIVPSVCGYHFPGFPRELPLFYLPSGTGEAAMMMMMKVMVMKFRSHASMSQKHAWGSLK